MENLLKVFLVSIAFTLSAVAQEQVPPDWIRQHDGIPIEAGLHWDWVTHNSGAVDSMRMAGVDIVHLSIDNLSQMSTLSNWDSTGFQTLIFRSLEDNWIQYYTDAKYTVWEAEGTPTGMGDATLERDIEKTDNIGSYIKRKSNVQNSVDTLIRGPYYRQDVRYYTDNCDTVEYRADFRMMLEQTPPSSPPVESNPEDTICIIQVTQSDISNFSTSPWTIGDTYIINQRVVRLEDFTELSQFDTLSLIYTLENDSAQLDLPSDIQAYRTIISGSPCDGLIRSRTYIQFKVIWVGKSDNQGYPAYLLSVDNITVYDERARELIIEDPSGSELKIVAQDNSLSSYHDYVTGRVGIDELRSIDLYEPIRVVTEILEDNTEGGERPLWFPMAGTWDGAWNNSNPK